MSDPLVRGTPLVSDKWYGSFLAKTPIVFGSLWLLGLGGLYWSIAMVMAALFLLRRRVAGDGALAVALWVVLIASIPIGVIAFGQPGRIITAVGNAGVWLSLAALLTFMEQSQANINWPRMIAQLGALQSIVVIVGLAAYPGSAPIPIGLIPEQLLPSGLETFASQNLVYDDWLGGAALRTIGTMANPTWAGAFAVITLAAAVYLWVKGSNRLLATFAFFGGVVTIALSLSRVALPLAAMAAMLSGIVITKRRSRPLAGFLVLLLTSIVVLISVLNWDTLLQTMLALNEDRQGSWESRWDIYAATFDRLRDHPFLLLGYGIKPQVPGLVASIATHSSLISLLFRGGLLALILFLILGARLVIKCWKTGDALGMFVVAFVLSWSVLEDLDGGHLLLLGLLMMGTHTAAAADREEREEKPIGEDVLLR